MLRINIFLREYSITFGYNIYDLDSIINHLIILGKQDINKCTHQEKSPAFSAFTNSKNFKEFMGTLAKVRLVTCEIQDLVPWCEKKSMFMILRV